MTLTKSEIAAVYRACEVLVNGSDGYYGEKISHHLFQRMRIFYNEWGNWSEDFETRQNERIMALLFFVAAKGDL